VAYQVIYHSSSLFPTIYLPLISILSIKLSTDHGRCPDTAANCT